MELLHKKGHYNFSDFKQHYINNHGIYAMQQFSLNAFYMARQNTSITFTKEDIKLVGITDLKKEFQEIIYLLDTLLARDTDTLTYFKHIKLPLTITIAEDTDDYILIIHEKTLKTQ